jgi:hypothetical protein
MSKCFISYRHTKPDEDLARFLEKFLGGHDHKVFLDTQIQVGTEWVKEIERQIKCAEFFIVLLSKESILSGMVRQEVKLAHELAKKRGKRFMILPIRVDFTGELPYDLAAYLDRIQYALWRKEEDFNNISQQVLTAIDRHEQLPLKKEPVESGEEYISAEGLQGLFDVTDAIGAPLPEADPRIIPGVELETGTVKLDSPFYVKRKADREIIEQIQKKRHHGYCQRPAANGQEFAVGPGPGRSEKTPAAVLLPGFSIYRSSTLNRARYLIPIPGPQDLPRF